MNVLRALKRYLTQPTRQPPSPVWFARRPSSGDRRRSRRLTHADIAINGHEVAVTEDDVGIVEIHEE